MKRKFLSTLLLFILAISLAVGTAVVSHAASNSGISISLAKNITANVTVADVDGAPKSATVYLKSGGNTVKTFNDVAVTTSGTTATLAVEISVKDIDKTVLVDFNGSEKTYEFTVKGYLQTLASTGTEAERAVASALVAYGESARAYFAGETVNAVSGSIGYDKEYSASSPISGLTHYSASLLLESETTIRHYFKVSGDVKNYTFFVDYDLDGGYDENEKLTAVEKLDEGGNYNYYVDISGIKPNDIDRQFTIYVTNGSSTYSCSYSAMNWAKRTFDKADSSNAAKALALGLAGYLNGAAEMKANINYYVNGALEKSVPYQYGVENYLAYAPEKSGYVFAGWFSNSDLTRPAAGLIPADETEDINVYAKFIKLDTVPDEEPEHDSMHIITDDMGDIIMEYNMFEATRLPDTYTGDGVFVGWYADAGFTKSINSITAGCSGTVTVYPKFEQAVPDEDAEIVASIKEQLSAFRGIDFGNRNPLNTSELSIQPNTAHPRVYVNETTLVDVKANLTHTDNASHYSALISSANASLDKTYETFPTGKYPLRAYFLEAENLAFAYLTTGKVKYGYKAIWYVLNYINQINNDPSLAMTAHEASTVIHITGEVYDWCYPLLSDEHKSQLINGTCLVTAAHSEDTYGYPPTTTEIIAGHGAERLVMRDWLAFAVAVADEAPDIYNYIAGKVVNEYTKMPNWYYVSNDVHQGTAYGTVARLYPNIAADMMMYSATGERIFSESIDFAEVIMSSIYKMRPDGESLRIGDDFNQTGSSYATGTIAFMAYFAGNYYGNATAKAWYKHLGSPIETSYAGEFTRAIYLITSNPSVVVEEGDLYNLELVRYNGSPAGSMIARSAWGDENAWMTYTNIEEAGANNHDHKDSGTFQIYYKGILAPNAGQYEHNHQNYNSTIHINYTKQTISKNGLLIYNPNISALYGQWTNSGGQRVDTADDVATPSSFEGYLTSNLANQAKVLGHDSAVNADGEFVYAYISGDITNSYNQSTVDLVMRSTMTLATGDPDHPMAFIVYDRITSDDASYKKSFVLHTMEEPTFNGGSEVSAPAGEDAAFTYISGSNSFYYTNVLGPTGAYTQDNLNDKYNGKLTTTTLLPENPVYRYIGGDGKRFWVNGVNGGNSSVTENPTKHPVGEIGWGRVEISPSVSQLTDSFLNVMYVGDAKDANGNATSNTLVPSTLVQCDTHEGVAAFGSAVLFSKTNESVSSVIKFTVDGTGEMNYYVGGLSSGKWFVRVGDGAATEQIVDAESGLLTFTANAGAEITLTPADLTFKLNYELMGGNINDTEYTTTFKADGTVTLPTDVTKANCIFYGFYMDSAYTTKATPELIKAKGSNVTVYARFASKSLVALDGQAINDRFTANEFKGRENAESGLSYTNNGDGTVTYYDLNGGTSPSGYGFFKTFDGSTLETNLASHPGEQKLYELSIEVGLVEGCKVLPFGFNGSYGWNLIITGTPHSDGKYYAYLSGTGNDQRVAELPSDGSLVTIKIYVDLTTSGKATYYAYNTSGNLKTYTSDFTEAAISQLGRVLIGNQVTVVSKEVYKPESYPAAIRLGKFFMKPILEIPSAT